MKDIAIIKITMPKIIRTDWACRVAEVLGIKQNHAKLRIERCLNPMSFNATTEGYALDRFIAKYQDEYYARLQRLSDSYRISGQGVITAYRLSKLLHESIQRYNKIVNPALHPEPALKKRYRIYVRHLNPGSIQVIGGWGYQLIRSMSGLSNESFSKEFTTLDYERVIAQLEHPHREHCLKARALPYHSITCTNGIWNDRTRYLETDLIQLPNVAR